MRRTRSPSRKSSRSKKRSPSRKRSPRKVSSKSEISDIKSESSDLPFQREKLIEEQKPVFIPQIQPEPQVVVEESFFKKYSTFIIIIGILVILGIVGLLVYLFVFNKKQTTTSTQLGPSATITESSTGDFTSSNIPINSQFIPQINSSANNIKFSPQGTNTIKNNYFGIGDVADVLSFKFTITLANYTPTAAVQRFKAMINKLEFQDYCAIKITNNSSSDVNFLKITNLGIGDITAPTNTDLSTPLSVGGAAVGRASSIVSMTNQDISNTLLGFLSNGDNIVEVEYGVIGSGNIIFDFSISFY